MLTKLRFLGVTDDAKLHIVGFPAKSEDNQVMDLFPELPDIKNTNKLPIIIEKLDEKSARVRVIGTHEPGKGETPTTWLSEIKLGFRDYMPNQMQKHPMGSNKHSSNHSTMRSNKHRSGTDRDFY